MLMRANRTLQDNEISEAITAMRVMIQQIESASTIGSLLGIEGNGSASYFSVFGKLLRGSLTFTMQLCWRD